MPEQFLHLPVNDRKEILQTAATQLGQQATNADRLSRHWYDLRMLAEHVTGRAAMNNRALLEDVVRHKQVFFNASYANYEACLDNQLCLIPGDDAIAGLRNDYEKMLQAGMMYEISPSFDDIMTDIREIERHINTW